MHATQAPLRQTGLLFEQGILLAIQIPPLQVSGWLPLQRTAVSEHPASGAASNPESNPPPDPEEPVLFPAPPSVPPELPPLVQTFEGRGVVVRTNEIVIDFTERDKDSIGPPGLRIDDYETFEPRRVEVPAGTRVTWKNTGHEPHTISVRGQTWTTGVIKPDSTGSIQFDVPGTYVFTCASHSWQQGEITVRR